MRIALKDDITLALSTLGRAKFRSAMTMLGVIIGVMAVVLVVGIGEGAREAVSRQIGTIDKDALIVTANASGDGTMLASSNSGSLLQPSDVVTLHDMKGVDDIAPLARVNSPVIVGKQIKHVPLWATSSSFPYLFHKTLAYGSFFSNNQLPQGVVLGSSAAQNLFGQSAPLGQPVTILGQQFVVYGVLDEVPTLPLMQGIDFNKSVFVSYDVMDTATKHALQPLQIVIKTAGEQPAAVKKQVTEKLRDNRGGLTDFSVLTQDQASEGSDEMLSVVTLAIIGVAAVSLLVGGVGIMNVMFASVNERTREIGLRKALGATNRQILRQFLTEALVVSGFGALVGIVMAIIASLLIGVYSSLQPVIDWRVIGIAFVITIFVGGFFGTLPAVKAARKDPIDALRHE